MPHAPKRRCLAPGCMTLATKGRCRAHTSNRWANVQGKPMPPGWAQIRKRKLTAHPICENPDCNRRATAVDHIIPRVDGGGDEWENLQALCGGPGSCHARKTAREGARRSNRARGR